MRLQLVSFDHNSRTQFMDGPCALYRNNYARRTTIQRGIGEDNIQTSLGWRAQILKQQKALEESDRNA